METMFGRIKIIAGIILLVFVALPAAGDENMLQVRGSDTIVNLAQRLAEVYSEKNPGRHVAVTGGGSGTGIAGLRNRTTDIANSSRPIRQREIVDMKSKGVSPIGIVIAMDCITLIVNEKNKVDKLTIGELKSIFSGDVVNWKDVGGDDIPITLYGRQSNSGTYEVFKENVIAGEYSDKMRRMNGNSQIVESIKNDISGIGYVGIGYVQDSSGLKAVRIAENEKKEYVDPKNAIDVESGRYPLTRPLYQYVDGAPAGAVLDFIKFELGPEGQKIVSDMGFISISKDYEEENKKNADI